MRRLKQLAQKRSLYSTLLNLVRSNGIFRGWRSALRLFRLRFLLRDWGVHCAAFPGRFAFGTLARVADGSRFAAVRRLALVRRLVAVRRLAVVRRFAVVRRLAVVRRSVARIFAFSLSR
jgi:hypothetical protein